MKSVYFQLLCGASGDMILSSLIDAGVPVEYLADGLARLQIKGLSLSAEKVRRGGLACSHIVISCEKQTSYRHLPDIMKIIDNGGYSPRILERCNQILNRLACAEAKVHGIEVERVHFHEIGAVDTIVDIVGTCLALDYLGVERILFSEFTIGYGVIEAAHGTMPNPAPATSELIKSFSIKPLTIEAEILTPTGAAVLTALGQQCALLPEGKISRIGYGCGDKSFEGHANCLRAIVLESTQPTIGDRSFDTVCVMETDMDHISGEILGFTAQQVMDLGALDVSWVPVFMKKGRPGYRLCVICRPDDMKIFADCIIANTRSLGVRYRMMDRITAGRATVHTVFENEPVDAKKCTYNGHTYTKPEYESLAKIARSRNLPLIEVIEAYQKSNGQG